MRSRRLQRRRRRAVLVALALAVVVVVTITSWSHPNATSRPLPSRASLAGLSLRERIVAIADSQLGYVTDPERSYCNKYSAYWAAGSSSCPGGEMSEKWCADFAAWVWRRAGVRFAYGFNSGQINARAASFYAWGIAHDDWHPATGAYVARPGDVAVYGLVPGVEPTAAHVAIVTRDPRGQRGPDVVNGDGDRRGFSDVETGTDQVHADAVRTHASTLAGYVSPP